MASQKLLLRSLSGETLTRPPFWFMRQAGRYLPEFHQTLSRAGSFLELCYRPEFTVEVTMQPVRRFGVDAAILFSDILLLPHALGQGLRFERNLGPRLDALDPAAGLSGLSLDGIEQHFAPVYQALADLRAKLPADTALIGFAGAPWTVACYMVEGKASFSHSKIKQWMYRRTELFHRLVELLVDATVEHLSFQIRAGAEVIQLFDSEAGTLDHDAMTRYCLEPTKRITEAIRARHPEVPVVVFPRGAGAGYLDYARSGFMQGLALDTGIPPAWATSVVPKGMAVQGNLDPRLLVVGGDILNWNIERLLSAFNSRPYVFNLGHGIVPETPPEYVTQVAEFIRRWN